MKNGFTLVEVVIASALLVLTMGALISAVIMARRSVDLADHRIEAMQVARGYMEGFLTNAAFGSTPTHPLHYGAHTISNGKFTGFYLVTTNSQFPNVVKDIALTLRWINPGSSVTSGISLNGSISSALHP